MIHIRFEVARRFFSFYSFRNVWTVMIKYFFKNRLHTFSCLVWVILCIHCDERLISEIIAQTIWFIIRKVSASNCFGRMFVIIQLSSTSYGFMITHCCKNNFNITRLILNLVAKPLKDLCQCMVHRVVLKLNFWREDYAISRYAQS